MQRMDTISWHQAATEQTLDICCCKTNLDSVPLCLSCVIYYFGQCRSFHEVENKRTMIQMETGRYRPLAFINDSQFYAEVC